MTGTEEQLIDFIATERAKFDALPPESISFPRTANNISKFRYPSTIYVKGTPLHVRGAIMFNHMVREQKITNKYNLINDGEKIKYCYVKVPNRTGENVISFINQLPKEFGLNDFIDYDIMWQKAFIDPLKVILDTIGWQTEQQATLFDFFA